ncbi:glycogen operon protein [Amaricoccus macauensis]|uniref:Glycogen operon protein n=2 Tax=Amaricoccus macauensis TaxID=57001 RepID=A0A840SQT9_9RHOB|nr:glycogen operon protein [Amaricoccus macauensis]
MWLCLFDGARERRLELDRGAFGQFSTTVQDAGPGTRYGFRADGPFDPERGHRFDPAKLLVDPYAVTLDQPFHYNARLAAPRADGTDTAALMPKAVVTALPDLAAAPPPLFRPGGFIYEVAVRPFTHLHPEVPEALRGTVAALGHPAILDHLVRLGVDAVELMPITAWIDERHLPPLGLTNGWGYNPVAFMALDPRICPGGIGELAATVAALRSVGIGTILDVVFNHTGESDRFGPTLSLRGLDNATYFRHLTDGTLVNDAGTGNTLACEHPVTRRLILDTLRHFVGRAGVDGFRFDLAPILGRDAGGFSRDADLFRDIAGDPLLADRVMIAEPWDIGPGGYQLGQFPDGWLEWNDRYRDRVRRFWRGDRHMLGEMATALAGSSDVFSPPATRSVNFIAAHDGFSLGDLVAYAGKHNEANGEENRDGHGENFSWNHGHEGPTDDAGIVAARRHDVMALLATLFASRGTIMLTAGDEFGRSQNGNNNAYAQDNALTWLDWDGRDRELEAFTAELAATRRACPQIAGPELLSGEPGTDGLADALWLTPTGTPMTAPDWEAAEAGALAMVLSRDGRRVAVLLNRTADEVSFHLPGREAHTWELEADGCIRVNPRAIAIVTEGVP